MSQLFMNVLYFYYCTVHYNGYNIKYYAINIISYVDAIIAIVADVV